MTPNIPSRALYYKKKSNLTALENQQINDLQKAYGANNVISAIRFARSAEIRDVARTLLQHCGFRSNLSAALLRIIPDDAVARRIYSAEKYQAGCRLAKATAPIEWEMAENAETLLSLWKSKVGPTTQPTNAVRYAINSALRRYGLPFAQLGIKLIPDGATQPEQELVALYERWLRCANSKSRPGMRAVLDQFGYQLRVSDLDIPEPLSPRLERYYVAKANREAGSDEKVKLWSMSNKWTLDEVLHAMSCVPSREFSLDVVKQVLSAMGGAGDEVESSIDEDDWDAEEEFEDEYPDAGETNRIRRMDSNEFYDYSTFDENELDSDEIMDDPFGLDEEHENDFMYDIGEEYE